MRIEFPKFSAEARRFYRNSLRPLRLVLAAALLTACGPSRQQQFDDAPLGGWITRTPKTVVISTEGGANVYDSSVISNKSAVGTIPEGTRLVSNGAIKCRDETSSDLLNDPPRQRFMLCIAVSNSELRRRGQKIDTLDDIFITDADLVIPFDPDKMSSFPLFPVYTPDFPTSN